MELLLGFGILVFAAGVFQSAEQQVAEAHLFRGAWSQVVGILHSCARVLVSVPVVSLLLSRSAGRFPVLGFVSVSVPHAAGEAGQA